MKLSAIQQDLDREVSGTWFTYPGTDFEVKIARIGNPQFEQAISAERIDLAELLSEETAPANQHQRLVTLAPIIARYLIRGWRGLTEDDGLTPVAFTIAKATEMLSRRDMLDFYSWVLNCARKASAFRDRSAMKVADPLSDSSSGNSDTAIPG
jgi:hypothetical protein